MDALLFDPETHRYSIGGRNLPSVTTVLKGTGIIDTSGPWFTPYHRDKGKAIHAACEYLDGNSLDWSTVDERIIGYVRAWQSFLLESGSQILNVERQLYSPDYGFAGTVDRVLNWRGARTVVDIKTGGAEKWHRLQTAAYQILDGYATARACVHVREDGKFRVELHPMKDAATDRARFLAALTTYNAMSGAAA